MSHDDTTQEQLDRRGLLRLGGFTAATAALIAACGRASGGEVGRVGTAPTRPTLPAAVVNDVVLLRTAASLHYSFVGLYTEMVANRDLLAADHVPTFERLLAEHETSAAAFDALTTEAGGTAFGCANPRIEESVLAPIMARILDGVAATSSVAAIPPSDDVQRDMLNVAHALETMSAATHQALVPSLSLPALRVEIMAAGVNDARHAALLALTISPGGFVNDADAANAQPTQPTVAPETTVQDIASPTTVAAGPEAPPLTEIPLPVAVPAQFGQLGATRLVVGAGDENGVRLQVNLDTPSLNTLVYEYVESSC